MGSCFSSGREVYEPPPPGYYSRSNSVPLPERYEPPTPAYTPTVAVTVNYQLKPPVYRSHPSSVPATKSYLGSGDVCYGKFRCGVCRHHWTSRRAWHTSEQKCEKCRTSVRPYSTRPLTSAEMTETSKDPDKAHRSDLCSKCKESGGDCRQRYVYRRHSRF